MSGRSTAIARSLEEWFVPNQRDLPWRHSYDPWQVWVSETMLQQTRMSVVLPYFEKFIERFPTVEALGAADHEEVLAAWSGLGYYRRARFLHEAAKAITRGGGRIPGSFEDLLTLPGVGRYTAGAIASIAFGERVPAVDGNVERISSRLESIGHLSGSGEFRREVDQFARDLVHAAESARVLNQALMEVGALICTPTRPRCDDCPVRSHCRGRASGDPLAWPKRAPSEVRRLMRIPLYVIRDPAGRVLLLRGSGRLLGDMYHLPHGTDELEAGVYLPVARAGASLRVFRHSITNRSIEFSVHELDVTQVTDIAEGGDAMWVHPGELRTIPHPSYVRKALVPKLR